MAKKTKIIGIGLTGGEIIEALAVMECGKRADVDLIIYSTDQSYLDSQTNVNVEKRVLHTDPKSGLNTALISKRINNDVRSKDCRIIILAGLGDTTDTDAALIIAQGYKNIGSETIGIVKFNNQDTTKDDLSTQGLERLCNVVDSLIPIHPDRSHIHLPTTGDTFSYKMHIIAETVHCLIETLDIHEALPTNVVKSVPFVTVAHASASGDKRAEDVISKILTFDIGDLGQRHFIVLAHVKSSENDSSNMAQAEENTIAAYINKELGPNVLVYTTRSSDKELGDTLNITFVAISLGK